MSQRLREENIDVQTKLKIERNKVDELELKIANFSRKNQELIAENELINRRREELDDQLLQAQNSERDLSIRFK